MKATKLELMAATLMCLVSTGCATCRENKAFCTTVAVGVVAGCIAASTSHREPVSQFAPSICASNWSACK